MLWEIVGATKVAPKISRTGMTMESQAALILDYENRSTGDAGFLLRLAGFSVTTVADMAEALNWASQRQRSEQPFALLLIRNLPGDELMGFVRAMHGAGVDVPMLFVTRDAPYDTEAVRAPMEFSGALFFCRPEQIGNAARALVARKLAGNVAKDVA